MIVLDASVLIALWGSGDLHADAALQMLDTEEELVVHPVTWAEVLVGPTRSGRQSEVLDAQEMIGISQHQPAREEPLRVAQLRAKVRLKLPDCYVLATAMELGAALATLDAQLASVAAQEGVEVVRG